MTSCWPVAASTASFTICSSRTMPFRPERLRDEAALLPRLPFSSRLTRDIAYPSRERRKSEPVAALHSRVLAPAHPPFAALEMAAADHGDHLAFEGWRDRFRSPGVLRRGNRARIVDARRRCSPS